MCFSLFSAHQLIRRGPSQPEGSRPGLRTPDQGVGDAGPGCVHWGQRARPAAGRASWRCQGGRAHTHASWGFQFGTGKEAFLSFLCCIGFGFQSREMQGGAFLFCCAPVFPNSGIGKRCPTVCIGVSNTINVRKCIRFVAWGFQLEKTQELHSSNPPNCCLLVRLSWCANELGLLMLIVSSSMLCGFRKLRV